MGSYVHFGSCKGIRWILYEVFCIGLEILIIISVFKIKLILRKEINSFQIMSSRITTLHIEI